MELKSEIKNFINELRINVDGLYKGDELQITSLCNHLNIEYFSAELPKEISGSILKNDKSDGYVIYVNEKNSRARQRFTIAHEIGHYISFLCGSHSKKELEANGGLEDYAISYRKSGHHSEAEREANLIAAELLMPQERVEQLLERGLTPEEMAEKFYVSISAMTMRIKELYPSLMIV